jgi:hypothetical protein
MSHEKFHIALSHAILAGTGIYCLIQIKLLEALVPIFPLLCYLVNADLDLPLAELLILFNLVGLGVVCFVKEIQYGLAATLAYTISHCCIRQLALYNYGLCFFAYFALRAIGFGHDLV